VEIVANHRLFFRPDGARTFRIATHGLRRGLHSCAASRLGSPQGLKPGALLGSIGTLRLCSGQALEAVPFHGVPQLP
jgi:hypothetical protein